MIAETIAMSPALFFVVGLVCISLYKIGWVMK
jgi:hypothetical protein